ncbi:MAG: hypothetical protein WC455_20680 [Dehalococcoidia bacterium]|jgi:hypothetical protein
MTTTKKPTGMRLSSDLIAELKAEAAVENRSLTNYVETILKNRPRAKETKMEKLNCRECGKEYEINASNNHLDGFCSDECQAHYHGAELED